MQIVIELSEKNYKSVMLTQNRPIGQRLPYGLSEAIKNGTILPKGHGRLIDADSLIKTIEEKAKRLSNADTINGLCGAVALIYDEQAIIEADEESETDV